MRIVQGDDERRRRVKKRLLQILTGTLDTAHSDGALGTVHQGKRVEQLNVAAIAESNDTTTEHSTLGG